ncbi:MAG: SDR family oxidoreductase [Thermoanaerobaculia bacterium]|jgi:NAD(P)-dependent dehydrogenase (short-subunit alcohol dehydrogenase family)
MQIDLSERVVLITGGSRGIGRRAALLLGSCGASVAITYATRRDAADEVVAAIGAERALAIRADAGVPEDVKRMVDETIARFGRIDVLVNNSAIHSINSFDGDDYDAWQRGWRRTIEVNLFGAANAAFLVIPWMKKQGGGKIINVASRSGFRGETEFPDYGASKAGMMNLTKSLARTHAKQGIIATCVAPGYVETDTSAHDLERFRDRIEGEIPLGRVAQPDDVAKTILFLASPLSDYLAGVTIDVNGGSYLR